MLMVVVVYRCAHDSVKVVERVQLPSTTPNVKVNQRFTSIYNSMKTKICTSCKKEKPLTEFNFKVRKDNLLQASCKICTREQSKIYYKKNVRAHVVRADLSRKARVKRFQDFKANLSCVVCGENEPCCIDFHHRGGSAKEFDMSKVHMVGWNRILEEISKCVALCSNCHRKVHAGIIELDEV